MANRLYPFWRGASATAAGFRRRPIATALAAAGTVLAGAGLVTAVSSGMFSSSPATAARSPAYVADPESLLDARSPGDRRYGWLVNTKPARFAADDRESPTERVLSSVRHRPPVANVLGGPLPVDGPVTGIDATPEGAQVFPNPEGLSDPVQVTGFGAPLAASGGTVGGGGVLPASGGFGGGSTANPSVVVPGVPEASTWAMLILGFAMTGAAMRKRRSGFLALVPG